MGTKEDIKSVNITTNKFRYVEELKCSFCKKEIPQGAPFFIRFVPEITVVCFCAICVEIDKLLPFEVK